MPKLCDNLCATGRSAWHQAATASSARSGRPCSALACELCCLHTLHPSCMQPKAGHLAFCTACGMQVNNSALWQRGEKPNAAFAEQAGAMPTDGPLDAAAGFLSRSKIVELYRERALSAAFTFAQSNDSEAVLWTATAPSQVHINHCASVILWTCYSTCMCRLRVALRNAHAQGSSFTTKQHRWHLHASTPKR